MDVDKLRAKIRAANDAYWKKSNPIITDTEYDRLVENLRALSPNDPLLTEIGKENDGEDKVWHIKPLLSLDKRYSWKEIIGWATKVARSDDEVFCVSPKYDGISIEQQNGRIITRGNGKYGTDITHLASHISVVSWFEYNVDGKIVDDKMSLYDLLEHDDEDNPTYMTGELLVPYWKFDKLKTTYPEVFADYKTPRNLASGFANSKSDSQIANLMEDNRRSLYVADFVSHRAFEIPVTLRDLKAGRKVDQEVMRFINTSSIDYPVDGIVLRLSDDAYAQSLGVTQHHPLGSMAFKFTSEQVTVIIKSIDWQIGKQRVSPVANFDPVKLDGVMVKRATLHNPTWVKVYKVAVGSKVVIERRGGVIPRVMDVINDDPNAKVDIPTVCPACGAKLEKDGLYLKCTNNECTGKISNQIVTGLTFFGLKGAGPSLVTKAVQEFYLRDIMDWAMTFGSRDQTTIDLLKKKGFTDNEIKVLTRITSVMNDGASPENILASVCIPKCSTEFARTIETQCGGIENLLSICPVDRMYDEIVNKCKMDAVTNFMIWIEDNYERFNQYFHMFHLLKTVVPTESKGTVCFTGAGPKPRKELQNIAISHGYQCTENANQATILVAADPTGNSSKLQKARKSGIRVIGYDEFLETIRG